MQHLIAWQAHWLATSRHQPAGRIVGLDHPTPSGQAPGRQDRSPSQAPPSATPERQKHLGYRPLASSLSICCADIGSIPNRRFGWVCTDAVGDKIERHLSGAEIDDLVEIVAADIADGRAVALGFECPLYVPVPQQPLRLGTARIGEGNRSWSAGAGAGALATGAVQVAWILDELRRRAPDAQPYLDWDAFTRVGHGLFLWEAFVTARAKAATHIDDATIAVTAFRDALPDLNAANAVNADRPLSLLGAALLWSGWSDDLALLHAPCLVVKATPPAALEAEAAGAPAEPTAVPRAHRDRREVDRKRALLEEPHVAPLTQFVRRLREQCGGDAVPWFDPTEAGVNARILLLFENPGRRADAGLGSGFISADNDDRSAETMWGIFHETGIDRSRDVVNWNILPGMSATRTRSARCERPTSTKRDRRSSSLCRFCRSCGLSSSVGARPKKAGIEPDSPLTYPRCGSHTQAAGG